MRNGIWRETDKHLVIGWRRHRSHYKQWDQAFLVCGILLWRAENLLESRLPRLRHFCNNSSKRLWETLHFSTLSTNNECNQRKSWRVNFHDHHCCASRSQNEAKLKRFGVTTATSIGWGQEEGMDEDTAMWKEVKGRCACEIIYGSPERQKKSYLKSHLATIKKKLML